MPKGLSSALTPTSHRFFSQRLRMHFVEWGSPKDPTIVLVHGVRDHCRTWDDLIQRLSAFGNYHFIAPDLRGHGDSEWVQGSGYRYYDYIYDLQQLIEQNQLGPVFLVGHSLGGAIAAFFAGVFPEHVRKLVLLEGIGLWRRDSEDAGTAAIIREWSEINRDLAGRLPRRYPDLQTAYQRMQDANPQLTKDQAMHLTAHGVVQLEDGQFTWKYDQYTYNFHGVGLSEAQIVELWQNIQAPTRLINADGGLEKRTGQDGTLQYFKDAELLEVSQAGHWTHHDQPEVVATMIGEFLG
jgi:pimeloyl-ACP methyl ester carboxylesterase